MSTNQNINKYNSVFIEWLRWYEVLAAREQHRVILLFISLVMALFTLFVMSSFSLIGNFESLPYYSLILAFYISSIFLSKFKTYYSHLLIIVVLLQISYSVQLFGGEYSVLRYFFPAVLLPFTVFPDKSVKLRTIVYIVAPLCLNLLYSRQRSLGFLELQLNITASNEALIRLSNAVFPFAFIVLPFLIVLSLKRSLESKYYLSVKRRLNEQNIIGLGKIYRGATEKIEKPLQSLRSSLLSKEGPVQVADIVTELKPEVDKANDLVSSLRYFSRCHLSEEATEVNVTEFIHHFQQISELQMDAYSHLSITNEIQSENCKFFARPAQIIQVLIDLVNYFSEREAEIDATLKIRDYRDIVSIHLKIQSSKEIVTQAESDWYFQAIRKYLSEFKAKFTANVGRKGVSITMLFQKYI